MRIFIKICGGCCYLHNLLAPVGVASVDVANCFICFSSQMAQVIQWWREDKVDRGRLVVEEKQAESKEEKTLNMEMSAMIGIGLYQLQFANNDELDITRRKMVA